MAMLEVNDINVYYGNIHAIKGVSFHVNEGEIISLIGANGAGKTTTLQTISGLLRSKTGSIKFMDQEISHLPAYKLPALGLAQVPEGRRVFLQMSVEENLELGAYTQSKGSINDTMALIYERFPRLKERRKQMAGTLSGGEAQRIRLATQIGSGLVGVLYILDEPSIGLHQRDNERLIQSLLALRDLGNTLIVVEHDEDTMRAADYRGQQYE